MKTDPGRALSFQEEAMTMLWKVQMELDGMAPQAARAGAYNAASWLSCAAEGLSKWIDDIDEEVIRVSEDRNERNYLRGV